MHARQRAILDLLQEEQRVNVRALAGRFAVSPMTIRRDLSWLEKEGLLLRTHGGGVAAGKSRLPPEAIPQSAPAKVAIGKLAAGLVAPGQTVMMDCGGTALQVARHLPEEAGITVATPSLGVAQTLFGTAHKVLLLGGELRREFPGVYGPLTESMLKSIHVDTLFIGCDGADSEDGFYTADVLASSLEQAMMRAAGRVVVVTESAKFGRRAFARYALPREVHTLVTDAGLSDQDRANLQEQGVTVLIATGE